MRKSSEKRQQRRKDVTGLNYCQISLLIESFHDKIKMVQSIYVRILISYGINHQLVSVVNFLITNVRRMLLIAV